MVEARQGIKTKIIMNYSDIGKVLQQGIGPAHPMFMLRVEEAKHKRQQDQSTALISAQTVARGFTASEHFQSASEFVAKTKISCPTWCGHEPKVTKWELGDRILYSFISENNSQHPSMLFEYFSSGNWRRIV